MSVGVGWLPLRACENSPNIGPDRATTCIFERRTRVRCHFGMVHEPTAIKEAMNFLDAKAAVDNEWGELKNPTRLRFQESVPQSESV